MQILPQGLDSQIDTVSPGIKSGLAAMTSNRSDSSFQDLLKANQRTATKGAYQPNQDKKTASSASSRADNQPYGQHDVKTPDKNNSYETASSCKMPKDTKTARTNQDAAAQQAGDVTDKTGKIQNDKADKGDTDTTGVLIALITVGQQGVTVQNPQTTGQVQGSDTESGVTETASTKNGPVSTDAYPPPVYTQGDTPSGLPKAPPLTPQAIPPAQTPAKDLTSRNIPREIKMAADTPSTETFMKGVTPSMPGETSQGKAPILDKGAGQTLQASSQAPQTSATSLGAAPPNKDSAAQTDVTNRVGSNATGVMTNQGIDKTNKATATPLSAAVNMAGDHRQISEQTNLQGAQANSALNAADIAAQPMQGPKDQKIAKGSQNIKDAAATAQTVTVGGKTTEIKIGGVNNRQDGAGINAGSDNAGKTAKPQEDPKIVKIQDQMPDQFVSVAANNASEKTSNGITPPRIDLIDKKDLAQTIKDQVFSNLTTGDKHVVLHLDPPDLGKIRIDLTLTSNNELKATFAADHPDVRNIIQGQMDGLKDHLDQKGFNLTQIKIDGGMQTGFTSLDQRGQGNPGNWAQEVLDQPVSKTDTGRGINNTTADLMTNAILSRNIAQNGRVNLVI